MTSIDAITVEPPDACAALSDDELVERTKCLAAGERRAAVALIRSLIEFDRRKLYLREGCSSLFTYCTQVLHLSEGSAYNRIETARAASRYPEVLDALERGDLTMTAVRLLAPHLTAANRLGTLAAARHRSKLEIQELIASINPRSAAETIIRRVARQECTVAATPSSSHAEPVGTASWEGTAVAATATSSAKGAMLTAPAQFRAAVTPLAPSRYKLQVTLTRETHDKLRRVQALIRHSVPDGDVSAILDRALTLLIDHLERRRCGRVASPRRDPGANPASSRHVPAAVKRAVWQRDEGRCAFVGRTGRCRETAFLEFHHVEPFATGGVTTAGNVQLRCRAHNMYEARLYLGDTLVRERQQMWGRPLIRPDPSP